MCLTYSQQVITNEKILKNKDGDVLRCIGER